MKSPVSTDTFCNAVNSLDKETVTKLWKKKYDFSRSGAVVKETERRLKRGKEENGRTRRNDERLDASDYSEKSSADAVPLPDETCENGSGEVVPVTTCDCTALGAVDDTDQIRLRLSEKKQVTLKTNHILIMNI